VGQHGTPFKILKFVTMNAQTVDTGTITRSDDPGVLAFGRALRRTKLNELPQLWNVLRGDMALVGPRPLPRSSFEHYPLDARQVITTMKPGLTGIGSVFFHDEERMAEMLGKGDQACYLEDIMPLKAELELWYARHRSVWTDAKIIAATCAVAMAPHARFYVTWFPVEPLLRSSSLYGYFMNSLSRAAAT
jgi:lipopolysaccharide/colanic/teichoic acid biosynthesis glycosyltransferase